MTGLWLVSYLVLWVLVVIEFFFLWVLVRQIGILSIRLTKMDPKQLSTILDPGMVAPNFQITDTASQKKMPLHAQLGSRTILTFLSSRCSVCRQLASGAEAYARQFQDGQRIIMVNIEDNDSLPLPNANTPHLLQGFPDEYGSLISKLHPLPWVMLIDKEKRIEAIGSIQDWNDVERFTKEVPQ